MLTVKAYDRTDTTEIATGTLATTDNQVDTSTGTVKLRAIFPNDNEELFPNQFVNARLLVDTLHDATLLPVAAVQHGSPGAYVYVVNTDKTVSVRTIKIGPGDDQHVSVISGISPGETVVFDGVDKLRDGARITIPGTNPAVAAARANYDKSVANYRQTVLAAFQNVEDELASLRVLAQQIQVEEAAVQSAKRAVEITLNEYQAGTIPYTTVITAQTTLLSDQESALLVQENRLIASVALVEALGGGWDTSQLPSKPEIQKLHLVPD